MGGNFVALNSVDFAVHQLHQALITLMALGSLDRQKAEETAKKLQHVAQAIEEYEEWGACAAAVRQIADCIMQEMLRYEALHETGLKGASTAAIRQVADCAMHEMLRYEASRETGLKGAST